MGIELLTVENSGAARPILEDVKKKIGKVPNIYAAMAHSPASLQALFDFKKALSKGVLSNKEAEVIALVVGQHNSCDYCLAAHTMMAKGAGLTEDQTVAARKGLLKDPKLQALAVLAKAIVEKNGYLTPEDAQEFYEAGYDQSALVEVIANVSINIFTNLFNHAAETPVDFPKPPAI